MMNFLKKMSLWGLMSVCTVYVSAAETKDKTDKDEKDKDIVKEAVKILGKIKPSLVKVQYFLKYDKGQAPVIVGYRCGNCNRFHGSNAEEYIKEDRPVEVPGYLTARNKVISADMMVHPRFLKEIKVNYQIASLPAKISTYYTKQNAVELEMSGPLPGTKPFNFKAGAEKPFFNVSYSRDKGFWLASVNPFSRSKIIYLYENDETYCMAPANSVILDRDGNVVSFSASSKMPLDESWQKKTSDWKQYSATEMLKILDGLSEQVEAGIFRVRLGFRSPKVDKTRSTYRERETVGTELNTVGFLLQDKTMVVLANLKPTVTARLESITAFPEQTKPFQAKFKCSLKDFGILLAGVSDSVKMKGVTLSDKSLTKDFSKLLPIARIKVSGETLTAYYNHSRIVDFEVGWKGMLYPNLPNNEANTFLFNAKGQLLALPVIRRLPPSSRNSYRGSRAELTQARYLLEILKSLKGNTDPSNIPVSEAEENRIAWLGIESQALNPELAKANKISEETDDGKNGVMVTYVYPGSPAHNAGLKAGDIILRLYEKGDPSPIKIRITDYHSRRPPFPWSKLDQVPEMYFDRLWLPWQSIENSINKLLTNLGFGKEFTLICVIDGKVVSKKFKVAQAPEHYETAKKEKSKYLGITVKNITFELRRYFQMKKDTPGIIISKIEPGSRASVAGLKPYEIITSINGQPVNDISQFDKLINGHKELRVSVKRMYDSRIVKIKMNNKKRTVKPAVLKKIK